MPRLATPTITERMEAARRIAATDEALASASGCALVHVDTIKVREHLSPAAPPDEDFNSSVKTEIARRQMMDHMSGKVIACAKCRTLSELVSLYRCYYCGVWYCRPCAGKHFESKHNTEVSQGND
jgi:hypothetical protein